MSTNAPQAASAGPASSTDFPSGSLRLWPAVLLIVAQWLLILLPGQIAPGTMFHFMTMLWTPMAVGMAFILWWLFASRAAWRDKGLVLAVTVAGGVLAYFLCDRSVPMLLILVGIPVVTTLWGGWLALTPRMAWPARRIGLLAVILATWSYYTLIRVDGTDGSISAATSWRWAPTAEQQFLASRTSATPARSAESPSADSSSGIKSTDDEQLTLQPDDWAEFRGPHRDNRLTGISISTDWQTTPPRQLWKRKLGPGWGSFAVVGDHLFTQEQRGDNEAVVCYRATDGEELWAHLDPTRFWEVIAGTGPRATPTFHAGRIYAVGANGRLNCLEATTGNLVWGVDLNPGTEVKVPDWGYASSPLIVGEFVITLPGRPAGAAVQAFDLQTGALRWSSGEGTHAYSSPQLAEIDGVPQILSQTNQGMSGIAPDSGKVLWNYAWPTEGSRVLQPSVDGDGVILTTYFGLGSKRLRVNHSGDEWSATTDWESKDFKPYFNDFVVDEGFAYGFDANLFCCVDLRTGKRTWKKGRYGYGQVLLLADQKLLLVLSETGELVLLKADPKQHIELARMQAIEGKTWNHPVIVRGRLYVRNAEEMACFEVGQR